MGEALKIGMPPHSTTYMILTKTNFDLRIYGNKLFDKPRFPLENIRVLTICKLRSLQTGVPLEPHKVVLVSFNTRVRFKVRAHAASQIEGYICYLVSIMSLLSILLPKGEFCLPTDGCKIV